MQYFLKTLSNRTTSKKKNLYSQGIRKAKNGGLLIFQLYNASHVTTLPLALWHKQSIQQNYNMAILNASNE